MNNHKCHSVKSGEFCALDIISAAGFNDKEVYDIAIEYTCFPMSCKEAQWQAARVIAEYKNSGVIKYLPEWDI
jgi:hypothetical protein